MAFSLQSYALPLFRSLYPRTLDTSHISVDLHLRYGSTPMRLPNFIFSVRASRAVQVRDHLPINRDNLVIVIPALHMVCYLYTSPYDLHGLCMVLIIGSFESKSQ